MSVQQLPPLQLPTDLAGCKGVHCCAAQEVTCIMRVSSTPEAGNITHRSTHSCMPVQVNTDMTAVLPCEDAARIAGKLEAQAELGPMRMLYDIAEVIEACGGSHMEVHLDCRQHRNESLLLPGLGAHQGPAICIKLPGAQPNASFACDKALSDTIAAFDRIHACVYWATFNYAYSTQAVR